MKSNLNDIMYALSRIALFASFALTVPTSPVGAVPYPHGGDHEESTISGPVATSFPVPLNSTGPSAPAESASTYWISSIKRQGTVPFGESSFKVFRNVREYGATGMSFLRIAHPFSCSSPLTIFSQVTALLMILLPSIKQSPTAIDVAKVAIRPRPLRRSSTSLPEHIL